MPEPFENLKATPDILVSPTLVLVVLRELVTRVEALERELERVRADPIEPPAVE
jgi:uncharacterized small protein (DUF1192 family)